jgi:hypothetical protein
LCPITIIIIIIILISLGLDLINEREHGSLAYLAQHDDLWFHSSSWKWHNFILHYGIIYVPHFLYLVKHLGWFLILAIVNSAVINRVCEYLLGIDLHSFGYMPKGGIAVSHGSFIFSFSYWFP